MARAKELITQAKRIKSPARPGQSNCAYVGYRLQPNRLGRNESIDTAGDQYAEIS